MNVEHWRQKKVVEALDACTGLHTSLITVLIPPKTQISRVSKMLTNEIGTAQSIKSKQNRDSVIDALTTLQGKLKAITKLPENGLAMFCGETVTKDSNKQRKHCILLEPIKPINIFLYRCGSHFHIEALRDQLQSAEKFGFIIVTGEETLWAQVQGNTQVVLFEYSVSLPKKHHKGGQSAQRFMRKRQEAYGHYITKLVEMSRNKFLDSDGLPNVAGLILAGPADFKNRLNVALPAVLRAKVLAVKDIQYGGQQGLNDAVEASAENLRDLELIQQRRIMSSFFEQISTNSNKYCFGVEQVMQALSAGAVEVLLVWETLSTVRKVTIDGHVVFGECAEEIKESEPLVDWFAENYKTFGCRLELVQDATPEGSQFCKGFGGLGGILRWAMDFEAFETDEEDSVDWDD